MKRYASIIDLFIKPSWLNLLVMIVLWYLLLTFYILLGHPNITLHDYQFYNIYSWPNFLYCYFLIIWIIPAFLPTKRYVRLVLATLLALVAFVAVRYFYYNAINPEMYNYYRQTPKKLEFMTMSLYRILTGEIFRGLEFTILSYLYRLLFDWFILERKKKTLENEKLKAELTMLRYQLNPHFLFNTINDIYYLAIVKSDHTADALLKLSELLRYVVHEKNEFVPLQKELEHLKQFIELHKFRFPSEVIISEIDPKAASSDLKIPPLLLSTFVENAFKHGQPGTPEKPLKIDLALEGNTLKYRVLNPIRPGMSKDSSSGIGQPNLLKRLSLLYPEKHIVNWEQTNDTYCSSLEIELSHD